MSEAERRYVPALMAIAERRVAALTAVCENGTADPEIADQLVRWKDTLASLRVQQERLGRQSRLLQFVASLFRPQTKCIR